MPAVSELARFRRVRRIPAGEISWLYALDGNSWRDGDLDPCLGARRFASPRVRQHFEHRPGECLSRIDDSPAGRIPSRAHKKSARAVEDWAAAIRDAKRL